MADQKRVLIVEDDSSIADTVEYALQSEGFVVAREETGQGALRLCRETPPEFVVLDVGLPDMSGFDVCKELRRSSEVPILFLTARASEVDRVVGLELGGDDYMVKPFSPRELTARVRAILRRAKSVGPAREQPATPFMVDHERRLITFQGHPLELPRYEYLILKTLVERPGRVYTRELLLELLWEEPAMSTTRTVDAHIKNIRQKLRAIDPSAQPIKTHRSVGYSLSVES